MVPTLPATTVADFAMDPLWFAKEHHVVALHAVKFEHSSERCTISEHGSMNMGSTPKIKYGCPVNVMNTLRTWETRTSTVVIIYNEHTANMGNTNK